MVWPLFLYMTRGKLFWPKCTPLWFTLWSPWGITVGQVSVLSVSMISVLLTYLLCHHKMIPSSSVIWLELQISHDSSYIWLILPKIPMDLALRWFCLMGRVFYHYNTLELCEKEFDEIIMPSRLKLWLKFANQLYCFRRTDSQSNLINEQAKLFWSHTKLAVRRMEVLLVAGPSMSAHHMETLISSRNVMQSSLPNSHITTDHIHVHT